MCIWSCVLAGLLIFTAALADNGKQEKPKTVKVGPNVVVELGAKRRVIVTAAVCLRKGPLEGLLTRKMKKEHEYILAADIDARHLHTALILAGAKVGSPVKFDPKFTPPSGTTVKISLRYKVKGKTVTVPASEWIRHFKTKKALDKDWVFGGSKFVPSEEKGSPPFYLANYGDLICVVSMESATLDLPINSPKSLMDRVWEVNTAKVPEKGSKVELILEPVPTKKKEKKR